MVVNDQQLLVYMVNNVSPQIVYNYHKKLKAGWLHLNVFSTIFLQRGTTFVTFSLPPWLSKPS